MSTPTITDYLKYANLQMAAEAFLSDDNSVLKTNIRQALLDGNGHVSRFTDALATAFVDPVNGWTVVDQRANTGTGFSGTLFKNNATGELVIAIKGAWVDLLFPLGCGRSKIIRARAELSRLRWFGETIRHPSRALVGASVFANASLSTRQLPH